MVFAWVPALALYFDDSDGNQLEFIHILEGESKPVRKMDVQDQM